MHGALIKHVDGDTAVFCLLHFTEGGLRRIQTDSASTLTCLQAGSVCADGLVEPDTPSTEFQCSPEAPQGDRQTLQTRASLSRPAETSRSVSALPDGRAVTRRPYNFMSSSPVRRRRLQSRLLSRDLDVVAAVSAVSVADHGTGRLRCEVGLGSATRARLAGRRRSGADPRSGRSQLEIH